MYTLLSGGFVCYVLGAYTQIREEKTRGEQAPLREGITPRSHNQSKFKRTGCAGKNWVPEYLGLVSNKRTIELSSDENRPNQGKEANKAFRESEGWVSGKTDGVLAKVGGRAGGGPRNGGSRDLLQLTRGGGQT